MGLLGALKRVRGFCCYYGSYNRGRKHTNINAYKAHAAALLDAAGEIYENTKKAWIKSDPGIRKAPV